MSYHAHQSALVARTVLALNRPVRPSQGRPRAVDMLRDHGERVWYDPAHRFEAGDTAAFRAIDDAGAFCWLVRTRQDRVLVSREPNPYDAIAAANAWPAPDRVLPWEEVQQLARSLRRREIRFRLSAEDCSGLSGAYVWLGRLGMPGWAAAWLMPVRPEIATAIWCAHRRTLDRRGAPLVPA
jgi:hypothetical protein